MMRRVGRALRGDRLACVCLLFLLLVLAAGILAPWLAPHDPLLVSWRDKFQPPGWRYPLGADALGRCIFSRLLFGIRTTVGMALLAMSLTLLVGTMAGVLAGFFSRPGGCVIDAAVRSDAGVSGRGDDFRAGGHAGAGVG